MDDEFDVEGFKALKKTQKQREEEERLRQAANDPETARLLAETTKYQAETLESSRRALATVKQTVGVAEKTTQELRAQGEQLERIQQTAESADKSADAAYQKAKDLHKYKGLMPFSIKNFFTGGKKKQQDKELEDKTKKLDKQAAKFEASREAAQTGIQSPIIEHRRTSAVITDQTEIEINRNLGEISSALDVLKSQGLMMQDEVKKQNYTINKIGATIDHTEYVIDSSNRKIQEFL